MRKLSALLSFFLICLVEFSIGQTEFTYNFGTTPTSSVWNSGSTISYFPAPVCTLQDCSIYGKYTLNTSNNAWSGNNLKPLFSLVESPNPLNTSGNTFVMRAATNENRFCVENFGVKNNNTGGTPTAKLEFRIRFDKEANEAGDFILAFGKAVAGFTSNGISPINLSPDNNVFLALKFSVNASDNSISSFIYTGINKSEWAPFPLGISLSTNYVLQFFANNSNSAIGNNTLGFNIPPRKWHMRVNGISPNTGEMDNVISTIGGIAQGEPINSFLINGYNSQTNSFKVTLDDLNYSSTAASLAALPALLKSFNVNAKPNSNQLNWISASELNNKGFEVQRSMGNTNDFKTIGFVGTKAKQGNSDAELSYSFDDADVKAGQTHYYRLNQVDFDGKSAFSPVKSIKPGSIESNMNVYPNPSQGSFTVNTGSTSGKLNIFVMDNTGRVVNQFVNVSTSNTRINNLKKGFYTLKIVNSETGEQSAQKIVVQ